QANRLETVHAGHEHVDDQQIEALCLEHFEPRPAIVSDIDLQALILEDQLNRRAHRAVVIDDENSWHGRTSVKGARGGQPGAVPTRAQLSCDSSTNTKADLSRICAKLDQVLSAPPSGCYSAYGR